MARETHRRRLLTAGPLVGLLILAISSAQPASGTLDRSGKASWVLLPADDTAFSLALQPDGKVVAAGWSVSGTNRLSNNDYNRDFALARYNPNGSLDRSFGTGGTVTTDFGADDYALAVVLQTDGKIVVAGTTSSYRGANFALARYNPNGSLDPSFGTRGEVTTQPLGLADVAYALVLQPDGKLVAAGTGFALARYNPNGSLDRSFGTGGTVTTDFGSFGDGANALALQPDGKLVAAGFSLSDEGGYNRDFALARYNPNGSLDASFGTDGKVTGPFSGDVFALVLQPDGKIIAAGGGLARYNPDGSLDPSFGTGGKVTPPIGAFALVLQPDGKIIAAGGGLARYNPDGSLDPSFGSGGTVSTPFGVSALALQPDGKPVAAGGSSNGFNFDFALARYNPNGSLDPSFGRGGKVTTPFRCVVPKVKGKKLRAAKLALRREDCSVGKVKRTFSAKVKKGRVISQRPKSGTKRQPGAKIKLKVSKGKKTRR